MIAKLIWNAFKPQLLKFYLSEQHKPVGFSELEYRFTDTAGKKYYGFGKNMTMPVSRFGKLQEYIMWMSSGLSGSELDKLVDIADKALTDGLTQKGNAAKVGSILTQIRERKNMVMHHELLINFIAVQVVREDESITEFDNQIHMEKVDQFLKDTKTNPLFFFRLPELSRLWHLLKMSEQEWTIFWEESVLQQKILNEQLKIYQSVNESSSSETTKNKK